MVACLLCQPHAAHRDAWGRGGTRAGRPVFHGGSDPGALQGRAGEPLWEASLHLLSHVTADEALGALPCPAQLTGCPLTPQTGSCGLPGCGFPRHRGLPSSRGRGMPAAHTCSPRGPRSSGTDLAFSQRAPSRGQPMWAWGAEAGQGQQGHHTSVTAWAAREQTHFLQPCRLQVQGQGQQGQFQGGLLPGAPDCQQPQSPPGQGVRGSRRLLPQDTDPFRRGRPLALPSQPDHAPQAPPADAATWEQDSDL